MIHYFVGEDTWLAGQAIQELAKLQTADVRFVDSDDLDDRSPTEWLTSGAGLFGKQLTVLRDAGEFPKALQEQIVTASERNDVTGVVWERRRPDKRSVLWKGLKDSVREFSAQPNPVLSAWLVEQGRERGGVIEHAAAQELVRRVGDDRWRLLAELDRLLLMSDPVTYSQVEQSIPTSDHAEIFGTLEALTQGQRAAALKQVQTLLEDGHGEFYILSMLAYQFRTLLLVRSGYDAGLSVAAIVRESGLKHFGVQKNLPIAQRKPMTYWRGALTRVLATDFAIRQGKVEARTGVLMLVSGLAQ